jgi:hypothetical protein
LQNLDQETSIHQNRQSPQKMLKGANWTKAQVVQTGLQKGGAAARFLERSIMQMPSSMASQRR